MVAVVPEVSPVFWSPELQIMVKERQRKPEYLLEEYNVFLIGDSIGYHIYIYIYIYDWYFIIILSLFHNN